MTLLQSTPNIVCSLLDLENVDDKGMGRMWVSNDYLIISGPPTLVCALWAKSIMYFVSKIERKKLGTT